MTVSSTGAMKAENEERFDLIPVGALRELAAHYGRGAKKYDDRNWEKGLEWHKCYASLSRHMAAFWDGEDIDEETGSKHIIAAAWHCIALATYMDTHPELDDRPGVVDLDVNPLTEDPDPIFTTNLYDGWTRKYRWRPRQFPKSYYEVRDGVWWYVGAGYEERSRGGDCNFARPRGYDRLDAVQH